MTARILITRPREDAEELAAALRARGAEVMIEPMLAIDYLDEPDFSVVDAQAILLTSANGARALGRTDAPRDKPVLAVGDKTAAAARDAGFRDVTAADGDVEALAALAAGRLDPARGPLVHVAGRDVAGDLQGALAARAFTFRRHVLYKARAAEALSESLKAALAAGGIAGVVFYSARTAATFVMLAKQAGVGAALEGMTAICLSEAVAVAARGAKWRRIEITPRPDEAALAL
jgi:uroporphyrinogen-III synthase